jgi:CDP-diacylglycerol--glycerol-3-phosphate 3-phosphatidyltransferase
MPAPSQSAASPPPAAPGAPAATGFRRRIPNALTLLRLLLAAIFFVLLAIYDVDAYVHQQDRTIWGYALLFATALFVVAALTDALDGYLARKWNAISVFGRVMDPFADKILILGAFVMLAGANFARYSVDGEPTMTSGVETWMVVVILARELLITSLRGMVESRGVSFAAIGAGKIKMIAQSVAVPIILVCIVMQSAPDSEFAPTAHRVAVITAWATTVITIWSAIPYLTRAWRAIASSAD